MKVILSGGGTIGSVSPLLAVYEEIKKRQPQADFLWLGTKGGQERKLIKVYDIEIKEVSSGKLRRYFSLQNFIDPFLILIGFFQSLFIILKFKPDVILSAGGFVSVPTSWAAWLLRKPMLIHQQDIRPGLANKLMTPFVKIITVTFEKSLADFPAKKVTLVGNPVRSEIFNGSKEEAAKFFKLESDLPTILIVGGGTGAKTLNEIVEKSIKKLVAFCQVIHITGGKSNAEINDPRYKSFDFLTTQLKNAIAASELVVTRGGLSALTEFSALSKPIIIVPMPDSHQEDNANEFFKSNAAAVINQKNLTPDNLVEAVKELLESKEDLETFKRNISKVIDTTAAEKIVDLIL